MDTFNKVMPGRVQNEGIVSGENLTTAVPTINSPAHFPDFAMVTPRGGLKRQTVATSSFNRDFGNTSDPYGKYYNPISYAIQMLGKAGQSSFGFKRLTNNTVPARVVYGITIFVGLQVPSYKRTMENDYELDDAGNPVQDGTIEGVFAAPGYLDLSKTNVFDVGSIKQFEVIADDTFGLIPTGSKGTFYPFVDWVSGVGEYNQMYIAAGHNTNTDWNEIANFISNNGTYPYTLNMGELLGNGLRLAANTIYGTPDATFTMFETVTADGVQCSPKSAVNLFTGNNVNRPVVSKNAPFSDAYVYNVNIDTVAKILYESEYVGDGKDFPPSVNTTKLPKHAVMNLLDLVDHSGKPYKTIVYPGNINVTDKLKGTRMGLNYYLQASGGIDPYADSDGKYPDAPTDWNELKYGKWVPAVDKDVVVSHMQYWEMNQSLLLKWLFEYSESLEMKDVIRNRTSFIWDMGYNIDIKNVLISFLSKRKDIIIVPCVTEYGKSKSLEAHYSLATMLNAKITAIPESDTFKSPACRAAINLWNARYIDEARYSRFTLNIDNMYSFAVAGGSEDGKIYRSLVPDHDINRSLRIAHDPQIEFEGDDPAANNLINGCITVTPLTTSAFCRPALPTVYPDINSVLKDLCNVWYCVCVEKILQDQWIKVSGDSQLGKNKVNYLATVKDNSEKEIRDKYGSVIPNYEVDTSFKEATPTAKSVMYAVTRLWLGKGVYMLNSILEAHNTDELNTQG